MNGRASEAIKTGVPTIYNLVLTPALRELLGNHRTPENIG